MSRELMKMVGVLLFGAVLGVLMSQSSKAATTGTWKCRRLVKYSTMPASNLADALNSEEGGGPVATDPKRRIVIGPAVGKFTWVCWY